MRSFFVILSVQNVFVAGDNQLSALWGEKDSPRGEAEWVSLLDDEAGVEKEGELKGTVEWLWGVAPEPGGDGEVARPFLTPLFKAKPKGKAAINPKSHAAALALYLVQDALSAHNRAAGRLHGDAGRTSGALHYVEFFKNNVISVPLVSKFGVGGYWYQAASPGDEEELSQMTKGFQYTVYVVLVATRSEAQSDEEVKALRYLASLYERAPQGVAVAELAAAGPSPGPKPKEEGHCHKEGRMNELQMKLDANTLLSLLDPFFTKEGGEPIEAADDLAGNLNARVLYCWVSAKPGADGTAPIAGFAGAGSQKIITGAKNQYCDEAGFCA